MRLKFFILTFLISFNCCFGESLIQPTKYEFQEEVLIQGGSIIISDKNNSILMYQTSETLKK